MPQWRQLRVKPAEVAARIKHLCGDPREPRLALLIGAGCSISAGIPAASRIVADYLHPHPLLAGAGTPPADMSEYAYLMSKLSARDRMEIINKCIRMAYNESDPPRTKLNWAHLLIATLVNHGYVRQILTTNFDPLLVDAMAITGQPVRTFDLTASDWYMPGRADRGSIMYLHGQAHGLLQAHTSDETHRVRPRIHDVLQEALAECTMIVIGYSGLCDPVFDELRDGFPQFRDRLYWCHYDPACTDPPQHLIRFLESPGREAFLVVDEDDGWMNADRALYSIAVEGLKLPLLPLVSDPLRHLDESLSRLCGSPPGCKGQPPPPDTISEALKIVAHARKSLVSDQPVRFNVALMDRASDSREQPDTSPISQRIHLAGITGDLASLRELLPHVEATEDIGLRTALGDAFLTAIAQHPPQQWSDSIPLLHIAERLGTSAPYWLATLWADALSEQANESGGVEADRLFPKAYAKYSEAVRLAPALHVAWYNWGVSLLQHARSKKGKEAAVLYAQAREMFAETVRIIPNKADAWNNWGAALAEPAGHGTRDEVDMNLEEACRKYAEAIRHAPNEAAAWNNWANCLVERARNKHPEAELLFGLACEKYAEATRIKPDMQEAWHNWGTALMLQARSCSGNKATSLFLQACDKLATALRLKPDSIDALTNWGTALADHAARTTGDQSDQFYLQAFEKYAEAARIKPNVTDTWINWGSALMHQSKGKSETQAERLLSQAAAKFAHAMRLEAEHPMVHFNSSCLAALRAEVSTAIERLQRWAELDSKASRTTLDEEPDFDPIRHDPAFQAFLDTLPP